MPSQGDVGEEIWAPLVTFFRCRRCVRCAGRAFLYQMCYQPASSLLCTCLRLSLIIALFEAGEQTLVRAERARACSDTG